jgi:tetratricopeptide (TPR) repeat protein
MRWPWRNKDLIVMRRLLISFAAVAALAQAVQATPLQDALMKNCESAFGLAGINACTQVIAQGRDAADAHFYRATRYYLLGQFDMAISDYSAAIALGTSRLSIAYGNRANVLTETGDYPRAFADYARALKVAPNSPVIRANRATAYLNTGDSARAIQDLDDAIAIDPAYGLAYARRGMAHLKRGDYDRAAQDLREGLDLDPEMDWAQKALDEALAAREAAATRQPISAPGRPATNRRVAIVFGNAEYPFIGNLANAGNDAREIAKALRARGYDIVGPQGGPHLNLTKTQMESALDGFQAEARGADVALIWYAGHGSSFKVDERQRENFLLPVEFRSKDSRDILTKAVSVERVKRATLPAGTLRILIVDACRDNNVEDATRSAKRGFQVEGRNSEIVIMFSTQPGAPADDGEGVLSPFAQGFLHELNANARAPLPVFLSAVAGRVKTLTKAEQIPEIFTSMTNPKLTLVK